MLMSRKETLAEEYAQRSFANSVATWDKDAFLAGYAACEQDAREMEKALEFYSTFRKLIESCVWFANKNADPNLSNPAGIMLLSKFPDADVLAKWKERGE